MEPTNPLAPIAADPLPANRTQVQNLVSSVYPTNVTHQFKVTFDMSDARTTSVVQPLDRFPHFVDFIEPMQYVEVDHVEIAVDCLVTGTTIAATLTHDATVTNSIPSITGQNKYFTHLVTPFTAGTIVRQFRNYMGMTRQLKPLPIDGRMPILAITWSNVVVGTVNVIIHYHFGGPIYKRVIHSPVPTTPTVYVEASGPIYNADLVKPAYTDEASLRSGFIQKLSLLGMTLADASAGVLRQTTQDGIVGYYLEMIFDQNKKCCSVGFVVEQAFRAASLAHTWYFGFDLIAATTAESMVPPPFQQTSSGGKVSTKS